MKAFIRDCILQPFDKSSANGAILWLKRNIFWDTTQCVRLLILVKRMRGEVKTFQVNGFLASKGYTSLSSHCGVNFVSFYHNFLSHRRYQLANALHFYVVVKMAKIEKSVLSCSVLGFHLYRAHLTVKYLGWILVPRLGPKIAISIAMVVAQRISSK